MVDGHAKLERVSVLAAYRGLGLGRAVVYALEHIAREKGIRTARLHAQQQTIKFYIKLGYQVASETFLEGGIPHQLMIKELKGTDSATLQYSS